MTLINTEYQGFTRKLGELCSFVLENVKNIPRLNNLDLAAFRILPADGIEITQIKTGHQRSSVIIHILSKRENLFML